MPPSGGPYDEVAPWLAIAVPESASTGHGPIKELRFTFSEKMDRTDAYRWLEIYPNRTISGTKWKGARQAIVKFEEPLPADTVVVVELLPGIQDKHKVPQSRGRIFVFATGDSIYDGEITGSLVLEDQPLGGGVVEIIADGPDTVKLAQRPVLRRTVADSSGVWRLRWLPANGDRWLLRAYADGNNDRRQADNEAVRLWPDTLSLTPDQPILDTGVRIIYKPDTPGELTGALVDRPDSSGAVMAFLLTIADTDTGYVPALQPAATGMAQAVSDTGAFSLVEAGPGLVRAIFFVDVDGDSLLGALPQPADTLWALEPWALVDSLEVEPGLPSSMFAPVWPDTLTPWAAPVIPDTLAALADSLGAALVDSLGAALVDSLGAALVDTLSAAPPDTLQAAPVDTLAAPQPEER